jgi:hypothetical protein
MQAVSLNNTYKQTNKKKNNIAAVLSLFLFTDLFLSPSLYWFSMFSFTMTADFRCGCRRQLVG